MISRT